MMWVGFMDGPDMIFAVDWALKTNYISIGFVVGLNGRVFAPTGVTELFFNIDLSGVLCGVFFFFK